MVLTSLAQECEKKWNLMASFPTTHKYKSQQDNFSVRIHHIKISETNSNSSMQHKCQSPSKAYVSVSDSVYDVTATVPCSSSVKVLLRPI